MKNSADLGGCYPPRPSASVDNALLYLQNSSYPTQPHSIIAKYTSIDYSRSPRHSRFFATPFAGIISGLGIICGPVWGSFAVLGSFAGRDHLRACTVLCRNLRSLFFARKVLVRTLRQPTTFRNARTCLF